MREVLATPAGARVLWRILGQAGIFDMSFVPGLPESTAFNEGRRSVGNWLWNEVSEADVGRLFQIMKERIEPETKSGDSEDE